MKKVLHGFLIILFTVLLSNIFVTNIAFAANHVHTDDCYKGIFRGNNVIVAATSRNIYYSYDGVNWKKSYTADAPVIGDVTYGNGKFIVTYGGYGILYSTDGISWVYKNYTGVYNSLLMYANGLFVGSGSNSINISTDGINWTQACGYSGATGNTVFSNGYFTTTTDNYFHFIPSYSYGSMSGGTSISSGLDYRPILSDINGDIAYGRGYFKMGQYTGMYYFNTGTVLQGLDSDSVACYNNNTYMMATKSSIYTSPNKYYNSWVRTGTIGLSSISSLIYCYDKWIVAGYGSPSIYCSLDNGASWIGGSIANESIIGIAYSVDGGSGAIGQGTPSNQGKYYDSYGNVVEPTCPAYITPPTVYLKNINSSTELSNAVLSENDTNNKPVIYVFDTENDNLTCTYYIGETKIETMTVTGTNPGKQIEFNTGFNAANLPEGAHTIRVTASDNYGKYTGEASCTFYVDRSAPTIKSLGATSSTNSITIYVSAEDTISGLATFAYQYTIGSSGTVWLTEKSFPQPGLIPNTKYTYTVQVRDAKEHIKSDSRDIFTLATTPVTTATAIEGGGIQLIVKDDNPNGTQYRVQVNDQYATSTGGLSKTESWFNMTKDAANERKLSLSGLSPNTSYSIIVSAWDNGRAVALSSNTVSVLTAPATPSSLVASDINTSQIKLSWNSTGAASYDLFRSTVAANGTVTATKPISNIILNTYIDTDVTPNQRYLYIIRCKNNNNIYSYWSSPALSVMTWPLPSTKVDGISTTVNSSSINIKWDALSGALGYEVYVSCDGKCWNYYTTTNQLTFELSELAKKELNINGLNCQCDIKVRAYNVSTGSDPSDSLHWTNAGPWGSASPCYTEAAVPSICNIDRTTHNSTYITWDTNGNPSSVRYILSLSNSGAISEEEITPDSAGEGKLEYNITSLTPETVYTFKLRSVNSAGVKSNWSNEVSVKTLIDKPSVVTGLKATAKSGRITLFWNTSERATSYKIIRGTDLIATGITSCNFEDTSVTANTEYKYVVLAVNTTGDSVESLPLMKKSLGNLPASPMITSVTGSSISCVIDWMEVDTATGYDIEVDGSTYNVGMATTYEDNGLLPGTNHRYRVRTRNIFGRSDWSEEASYFSMPSAPDIPSNIIVSSSATQLHISWDGVEGAETYHIEIDGTTYSGIYASEYTYTVPGTEPSGSLHTIRIRSVNAGGMSEWSASSTATLSTGGSIPNMPVPSTPEFISSVTGSAITLVAWTKVDNATLYQLEADDTVIYTGTGTNYAHTGLEEGSQHIYRIRSGNSGGFSDWSSPVSVTIGFFSITAPENINYYRVNDNTTAIIWDKVSNAVGYRIEINGVMLDQIYDNAIAEITTKAGTQYSIRIASILPGGETSLLEWSEEMVFCTPNALPSTVTYANISAGSDAITLSWIETVGAHGYEIEINGQLINVGKVLSYTITGLAKSTTYNIKIRAYNDAGAGSFSAAKSIMTNSGAPGVPLNISIENSVPVQAVTGSAITMKWNTVAGAVSYEVIDGDGMVYSTDTNSLMIEGLIPGKAYNFSVRTKSESMTGAWSSRISIITKLTTPVNIAAEFLNGSVHLSWNKSGGAQLYEIELDGIIYTTTSELYVNLDPAIFCVERRIRVRACYEAQKSEWSEVTSFNQDLQSNIEVMEGEEFSVILPYKNAEIGTYRLALTYNSKELELIDACDLTYDTELSSTYIEAIHTYLVISQQGDLVHMSFVSEDDNYSWTGIASSIKFRSRITGTAALQYSITIK